MMTAAPTIPAVRDVRSRLRRVRRSHSDRSLGELLGDVYMFALLAALYGGSSAVSIRHRLGRPPEAVAGTEATRAWLVLALVVAAAVFTWRGLRTLGPLLSTPAAQAWCVATPIDRAGWLRTPMAWLLATAAVAGAGAAVLAAWAGLSTAFAWVALTGAGCAVTLGALAIVAQSGSHSRVDSHHAWSTAAIGSVLLVAAAVASRAFDVIVSPPRVPAVLLAAPGVVAAVASVRLALRALPMVDRSALAGGAQLLGAATSAAMMLDLTMLSEIVAARRWRRVGKVHTRHWLPGGRSWVLLQADLRRQWRLRPDLAIWAALILVPYATAVFAPAAVGSVRIVAAYLAVGRLAGGLRTVCRSAALRRSLGGTDAALRQIHLVVPAAGLTAWWLCSMPAGGAPSAPTVTLILMAGVLAAVYRTATRKPMSYDGGAADTPFGPIPVNLLRQVFRGLDLVAVVVLVGILFSGPAIS
jgi:Family of unknown function (DUF6297)